MKKENRILTLWVLVMVILLTSILFDFFTTYLLFEKDYGGMMEHETNQQIIRQVEIHGLLGVFIPSTQQIIDWLTVSILGSFIIFGVFFDDFRTEYLWWEKVAICIFLSFLLISSLHIGAGISNLVCLMLGRWSIL